MMELEYMEGSIEGCGENVSLSAAIKEGCATPSVQIGHQRYTQSLAAQDTWLPN